jgi:hypothetical protein
LSGSFPQFHCWRRKHFPSKSRQAKIIADITREATQWHKKFLAVTQSHEIFDLAVVKGLIESSDSWNWAGSCVDFCRDCLTQLQSYSMRVHELLADEDWEMEGEGELDRNKFVLDLLKTLLPDLEAEQLNIQQIDMLILNNMIDACIQKSKSKTVEELDEFQQKIAVYISSQPDSEDLSALKEKHKELESVVDKGRTFRNKARAFRRQKVVSQIEILSFWENASQNCPVKLEELDDVLAKMKSR